MRKGKRGRVKEWKKGKSRWNKARVGRGREKTGEGGGGNENDCSELSKVGEALSWHTSGLPMYEVLAWYTPLPSPAHHRIPPVTFLSSPFIV